MYYELVPTDGRKSFYGKARVYIEQDGTQVLVSYRTPVIAKKLDGTLVKLWDGWSLTTGRHIRSFAGIAKAEWDAMPIDNEASVHANMIAYL